MNWWFRPPIRQPCNDCRQRSRHPPWGVIAIGSFTQHSRHEPDPPHWWRHPGDCPQFPQICLVNTTLKDDAQGGCEWWKLSVFTPAPFEAGTTLELATEGRCFLVRIGQCPEGAFFMRCEFAPWYSTRGPRPAVLHACDSTREPDGRHRSIVCREREGLGRTHGRR